MSKVVCAIQPCRALERSEREMRLERGKRGAEEKKAVAKQPSHPGSAAAPPREVPTVCAPPLRTHVTHDDQRLGFVERPVKPRRRPSWGCAARSPASWPIPQNTSLVGRRQAVTCPGARSLVPASSRPMDCSSVLASGPPGRSPKPRCNPS